MSDWSVGSKMKHGVVIAIVAVLVLTNLLIGVAPAMTEIIIDDVTHLNNGFYLYGDTAGWYDSGDCRDVTYNGHAYYTYCTYTWHGSNINDWAQWRPNLPVSGQYSVSVYVPYVITGRPDTSQANYEIHYAGGSTVVTVNQNLGSAQWVCLGTWSFNAGTSGYVEMYDITTDWYFWYEGQQYSKTIKFDAMKFTLVSTPTPTRTQTPTPTRTHTPTPTRTHTPTPTRTRTPTPTRTQTPMPTRTYTPTPTRTQTPTPTPTATPTNTPTATPSIGPALAIPERVTASSGGMVILPVSFVANDHNITSLIFSVDYDQTWLAFDPTDSNGDGVPDAAIFNLPGAFSASVTFDGGDMDGELDFFIADLFPPLASLSDGTIVSMVLNVGSPPSAMEVAVSFSQDPAASFGNTSGESVSGTMDDGSVLIMLTDTPTTTPTETSAPTPTNTPTAPPSIYYLCLPLLLKHYPPYD